MGDLRQQNEPKHLQTSLYKGSLIWVIHLLNFLKNYKFVEFVKYQGYLT